MILGRKQGDPRVKRILDALELTYSIDSDGDFKVELEFDDGRSQMAYIDSATEHIGDFEIREIWSVAYISEGFLDADIANRLLLRNSELKIGSWRLIPGGNNTYLVAFCIQVAADCDPNAFAQSLGIVLEVADEMEEALTGGDRL